MKVYYPKHNPKHDKSLHYSEATHKYCIGCESVYNVNLFCKTKSVSAYLKWHYDSYCKECRKVLSKKQTSDFLAKNGFNYSRVCRYNIPRNGLNVLLSAKGSSCWICHKTVLKNGIRKNSSNIDHCHKTNNVRGILCKNCNNIIGFCGNDKQILQNAINYLEDNGETVKRILGKEL